MEEAEWKKILFKKQPFPDNYVDKKSFLKGLIHNANFHEYDFKTVVQDSVVIAQQISSCVIFILVFIFTSAETIISQELLLMADVVFLLLGNLMMLKLTSSFGLKELISSTKTNLLLFGTVLSLTPVLQTLTKAISDDTIFASTTILILVHLISFDYSFVNDSTKNFYAPVSLNAAIFASILLGSRLTSNLHVFGLISFAIELFALFPHIRHQIKFCFLKLKLKKYSLAYHFGLSFLMFLWCTYFFLLVSKIVTLAYVATIFFISFLCPLWLIKNQKYKRIINGPWDEASIKLNKQN